MRFHLCCYPLENIILNGDENGISGCALSFRQLFGQLDKTEASKCFLEELNERFVERYLLSASQYSDYLDKFNSGNVILTIALRQDSAKLTLKVENQMMKILRDVFDDKSVEICVKLSEPKVKFRRTVHYLQGPRNEYDEIGTTNDDHDVCTSWMRVEESPDLKGGFCVNDNVVIPKQWKLFLKESGDRIAKLTFFAKISVEVSISGTKAAKYSAPTERMTSHLTKRILEQGIQSDVTIIASDGSEIKSHKTFLAAQSRVLTAMFQSDCKESSTRQIEMPGMTEEGIKSFLAFLYYGDLTQANQSCQLAFDLLEAGHKYEVASLEEDVKQILLGKSIDWFEVDVALRLFSLYGKLEGFEDLRRKALQVMKAKYDELEECEDFKELFTKDPTGAMLLCKHLVFV